MTQPPRFLVPALLGLIALWNLGAWGAEGGSTGMEAFGVGPWGRLEGIPLLLEPSDDLVSRNPDLRAASLEVVWEFKEPDLSSVSATMADCGIKEAWIDRLLSPEHCRVEGDLIQVRPPAEVLLGMAPDLRSRLYQRLSPRDPDSPYPHPYSLLPGGIRSNARVETGISPEHLDLIEKLSFKRGLAWKFSDIYYVFAQTPEEAERRRIVKTLMREKSYSIRLRITPDSDLGQLSAFWTSRGRNKEIQPMFESVVATAGVDSIDIAHLLPPLPRRLLNTYPELSAWRVREDAPDCFWTAFSFFSSEPTDRYLDFVGHVFEERYMPATRPLELGDLVLVLDRETGEWVHACNYLAANLVFTKNGHSAGRPWVIQTLDEVAGGYALTEETAISFYRLRPEFRR